MTSTPHGSHRCTDSDREFYLERFEQRYVRVSEVPPGYGNRKDRRAGRRHARLRNDGRGRQ